MIRFLFKKTRAETLEAGSQEKNKMTEAKTKLESKVLSSLEKVFPDSEFDRGPAYSNVLFEGARGETAAFQIAFRCTEGIYLTLRAESELPDISFREVCYVPCELPGSKSDPCMLRTGPGLYPDPLRPLKDPLNLPPGIWKSVWISVPLTENLRPGIYDLKITASRFRYQDSPFESQEDFQREISVRIRVHSAVLPKQSLILTNWFYADCLAEYYHVRVWSEKFWKILENYLRDYTAHGRNMLLTPLWSVPLDTRIGGERPTAQLLEIEYENGKYRFDFSRLKRWIGIGRECGVEYFEMSHFFTQWGAQFTPKIIVRIHGRPVKKFGWHVPADSPEYQDFLKQLMPVLIRFLRREKLSGRCYFHFSDEPFEEAQENYRKASALLQQFVDNDEFPVIDALSSVRFFRDGLVKRPVPMFLYLDDFRDEKLPQKWCYFCGTTPDYPARSYGVPLFRCRILGVLLYLYDMEGFLHWGHNFWFTQYSRRTRLDPWKETTAGGCFTGGNIFNVYPGDDGHPVDSLHYESFTEAMQDLRLLRKLEETAGRKAVVKLIHAGLDYEIRMNRFPHSAAYLENLHTALLRELDRAEENT